MDIEENREETWRGHKPFYQPTSLLFTQEEVEQVDWEKVFEEWK